MINKTIKWFCARIKIIHDILSVNNPVFSHSWRTYKVSYLMHILLLGVADLSEMLTDNSSSSEQKIDKLAEISLYCMMFADKLKDKKK